MFNGSNQLVVQGDLNPDDHSQIVNFFSADSSLDQSTPYNEQTVQEYALKAAQITQAAEIISSNAYLYAFYEEFLFKFIQKSTTLFVVSSGEVPLHAGKVVYPVEAIGCGIPVVEGASHLLHIPVVSALSTAGNTFVEKASYFAVWAYKKYKHRSDEEHAKRLLAVFSRGAMERVALNLAMIYQRQICQLTEKGARRLAGSAFELIYSALQANELASARRLLFAQYLDDAGEKFVEECFYTVALGQRPLKKKILQVQKGSYLKGCSPEDIFRRTNLLVRSPMGNNRYFDVFPFRQLHDGSWYGHRLLPPKYLQMFPTEVQCSSAYTARGPTTNLLLEDGSEQRRNDYLKQSTRRMTMYEGNEFSGLFVPSPVYSPLHVPFKRKKQETGKNSKPISESRGKEEENLKGVPSQYSKQWTFLRETHIRYTDEEMYYLFNVYASEDVDSAIQYFRPILVRNLEQRKELKEKLIKFHKQHLEGSKDGQFPDKILVPLNWGNSHWSLVEVEYLDRGAITHINYFDPEWKDLALPMSRSTQAPSEVLNIFNDDQLFPRSTVAPMSWSGVPEKNDSGILLLEIARRIFNRESLRPVLKLTLDIKKCRMHQRLLLKQLEPAFSLCYEDLEKVLTEQSDRASEEKEAIIHKNLSYIFNDQEDERDANDYWYRNEEIDFLLQFYGKDKNIHLFSSLLATGHDGKNDLFDALVQFEEQRIRGVIDQKAMEGGVLIPINSDLNHWRLLHLIYPTTNREEMRIRYFDPLGRAMPVHLQELLHHEQLFPGAVITPMFRSPTQKDGYNCGPWIVEAARVLFRGEEITSSFLSLNMNTVRAKHREIFHSVPEKKETEKSAGEQDGAMAKKFISEETKSKESEDANEAAFYAVKTGNLPLLKALVFDRSLAENTLDRLGEYCKTQYQNNTKEIRSLELWVAQLEQLERLSGLGRVEDLYNALFFDAYKEARERCMLTCQNYLQGVGLKLESKALYEVAGDDDCWREELAANQGRWLFFLKQIRKEHDDTESDQSLNLYYLIKMRDFISRVARGWLGEKHLDAGAFRKALDDLYRRATPAVMNSQEKDDFDLLMKGEKRALIQAMSDGFSQTPMNEKYKLALQREAFAKAISPDVLMMEMAPIDSQLRQSVERVVTLVNQDDSKEKGTLWTDLETLTMRTRLYNALLKLIQEHDRRVKQILLHCPERYQGLEIEELRTLLNDYKVSLSAQDSEGNTFLHLAKECQRPNIGIYLTAEDATELAALNALSETVLNAGESNRSQRYVPDRKEEQGKMNLFMRAIEAKFNQPEEFEKLKENLNLFLNEFYKTLNQALGEYQESIEKRKKQASNTFFRWVFKWMGISLKRMEDEYWVVNDAVQYHFSVLDPFGLSVVFRSIGYRSGKKKMLTALQAVVEGDKNYFPGLTVNESGALIARLTAASHSSKEEGQREEVDHSQNSTMRDKNAEEQEKKRQEEVVNLRTETEEQKEKTERLERENEEQKEKTERLERENEEQKEKTERLERENEKQKEKTERLERENEEQKEKTERLERENEKQRTETEDLRNEMAALKVLVMSQFRQRKGQGKDEEEPEFGEGVSLRQGPGMFRQRGVIK